MMSAITIYVKRQFELSSTKLYPETKCETFHMKMSFHFLANITHFHVKDFAPDLALKQRQKTTRK